MTWRGVQGRKKKLEKLYDETHNNYDGAYKDEEGRIVYKSHSRHSDVPKFFRRKSNKKNKRTHENKKKNNHHCGCSLSGLITEPILLP